MKKRRALPVLLCVAAAVFLLGGCGKAEEKVESAMTDEKVNLKFYIWSDEENYMTEVADNYNKSQDKTHVEIVTIPNESYDDKLKVMLSAGSDADIVDIRTVGEVLQFENSGALLDLTDKVQESSLDISNYGAAWDSIYTTGTISALPTRTTCWMLFYNSDMFKDAGIQMPEQPTWDEYREMSKKFTSGDGTQYGGTWVDWGIYPALATQKGIYLNDDDLTEVQASLEYVNELLNVDKSHTPLAEIKSNDSQWLSDFENKRTAMVVNGEWLINMLLTDQKAGKTDINWEVAPMPVGDGVEAGTTWGSFQFAGIPKDAKHPEESFDFLQYLCGDGGASVLPAYGMLPAYASEAAQDTFDKTVGKESASKIAFNAKKVQEIPAYGKYSELDRAFREHAELYLFGEKNIEDTMENFKKQREDIMSD